MSNGRNRLNPRPNPEQEWYNNNKGKLIRLEIVAGDGEVIVTGRLAWVTPYKLGIEVEVGSRMMIVQYNKAWIVSETPLE